MARKMKDSGIEWIGVIPDGWSIHRLKSCVLERDSGAWGSDASGNDGDMICLRIADFDYGRYRFKDVENPVRRNYDKATIERLVLKKNDLLVEKSGGGDKTPVGRMVMFDKDYPALYANFMDRLRCRNFVIPKWFLYLWNTFYSNGYVWSYIKQTTGLQNYDLTGMLTGEKVALPSLKEQQQIADFLDAKCASIDDVIAKTNVSIEEYKKLKQALISDAVTKGVRGKRPMRDSGIDWIGQIPKEWNVVALRYLGQCQNGISKGAEFFGSGYPFVNYSDVYKNTELPKNVDGLVQSTAEERERYSVKRGDIFFTRTSETIEEIGFTSVCTKDIENATFAGFLIRVRPIDDSLNPDYAKYYFRSDIHRRYFVKEMIIVIRASLGQELLKKLPVLLPSKDEQQEIADYLDSKCASIDTLISKKQQFIDELTAYKKSLIYEYVTGKKEVPA